MMTPFDEVDILSFIRLAEAVNSLCLNILGNQYIHVNITVPVRPFLCVVEMFRSV